MNTPLLQRLREHLASISKEQFQNEWAQIEAMDLEGPSMEEFLNSISYHTAVSKTEIITQVNGSADFGNISLTAGDYNYAKAA